MTGAARTQSQPAGQLAAEHQTDRRGLADDQEALALFEAQHDQPGMAETLDLLGTVYNLGGD